MPDHCHPCAVARIFWKAGIVLNVTNDFKVCGGSRCLHGQKLHLKNHQTDVGVCFENAKKIGMDRFQLEWVQAKAALRLGKHLIIASGEVLPKGRYNTTDLDTGVTEVGY